MAVEITYTITAEQDDLPVHGNASAIDDATDKEIENEIYHRLDAGDVWAWASVKVTATCDGFTGCNYLGGCNYKDEADFKTGGYFEQMCEEALDDLRGTLQGQVERGNAARKLLKQITDQITAAAKKG